MPPCSPEWSARNISEWYRTYMFNSDDSVVWASSASASPCPAIPNIIPQIGDLLFYVKDNSSVPGHVALSLGGDQALSLWLKPNNNSARPTNPRRRTRRNRVHRRSAMVRRVRHRLATGSPLTMPVEATTLPVAATAGTTTLVPVVKLIPGGVSTFRPTRWARSMSTSMSLPTVRVCPSVASMCCLTRFLTCVMSSRG